MTSTTTVRNPHTGLHTPDTRLAVTSLRTLNTSRGVAFTAMLRYDGKPVGTIENEGCGGMTMFQSKYVRSDPKALTEQALDQYAAQCRTDAGATVTVEHLLDDLVDAFEWTKKVTAAAKNGRALLRRMQSSPSSDDSMPAEPYAIAEIRWGMPAEQLNLTHAAAILNREAPAGADGWWQIWLGGRWTDVTARPAYLPAEHLPAGRQP